MSSRGQAWELPGTSPTPGEPWQPFHRKMVPKPKPLMVLRIQADMTTHAKGPVVYRLLPYQIVKLRPEPSGS